MKVQLAGAKTTTPLQAWDGWGRPTAGGEALAGVLEGTPPLLESLAVLEPPRALLSASPRMSSSGELSPVVDHERIRLRVLMNIRALVRRWLILTPDGRGCPVLETPSLRTAWRDPPV